MNKAQRIKLAQEIKTRLKGCRDKNVRIKVELFILALRLGNVKEACARRGFARTFYYKWWKRFKKSGFALASLKELSRRPHRSPRRISSGLEKKVRLWGRRGFGAMMIQGKLLRLGHQLSRSCISHVLRGRKRKSIGEKPLRAHRRRYELLIPGQRVQVDVKYVPKMIDGQRVYNYVAIDECTRLRFVMPSKTLNEQATVDFLDALKQHFPFPIHCLQTDNGFEFTFRLNPNGPSRDHLMSAWCKTNGIRHRLIPPGEKELNGKVERSHRIDEEYFYRTNHPTSFEMFKAAYQKWLGYYNNHRPHGGLNFQTPEEKLKERQQTLQRICFINGALEKTRLRFVRSLPINTKSTETLLEDLELELKKVA